MCRINVPADVSNLAKSLAILGDSAAKTCAGYSTRHKLEQLYDELGKGKGAIMKLRRVVRDMAAAEAARERDEARAAAIYRRDKDRLTAERDARVAAESRAAGLGAMATAA